MYIWNFGNFLFLDEVYYDEKEILSDQYQRPYQYLMQLSDSATSLNSYTYSKLKSKLSADEVKSFLDVVLRYMFIYTHTHKFKCRYTL